ncbi:FAD-dependent oxidoreductase [Thalassotalea euphylliae]|uniref:FAD-dependent oxidoreductase n=1 Tax=Thalassotalea euphylliae TaxID=1655234 RepID=UPI0036296F09
MAAIAIVGAGLLGRLTAWQLAHNHSVTLFDKDSKQGVNSAAYTAAGLLTPYGESLSCEPDIVEMGIVALTQWPTLLCELPSAVDFQVKGSLCVSHAQDQGDYLRFVRHIEQCYPQAALKKLASEELSQVSAAIAQRFGTGAFIPGEGCIDNHQLLEALTHALELAEVKWHQHTLVKAISPYTVKYENHAGEDKLKRFDLVIDCRGIGASVGESESQDESALTELRPVRGEVLRVRAPEVDFKLPVRLMHPRYKLYISPKANHEYVIGATEIESGDTSGVTIRSSLELLSALYSLHPGFAEAEILEQLSHRRPAFADNKPKVINQSGLLQLNGLYRHGYLLAPVMLSVGVYLAKQQLNPTEAIEAPPFLSNLVTHILGEEIAGCNAQVIG